MTIDESAVDAIAEAVSAVYDPAARAATAISAAWNRQAPRAAARGEVQMHAERQAGGAALLRMTAGGKSIEAVLSNTERLSLIRYLTAGTR